MGVNTDPQVYSEDNFAQKISSWDIIIVSGSVDDDYMEECRSVDLNFSTARMQQISFKKIYSVINGSVSDYCLFGSWDGESFVATIT